MSESYVIDGYNVIGLLKREGFIEPGASLEERRSVLLGLVSNFAGHKDVDMHVVFDGRKDVGGFVGAPSNVKVVFSDVAHSADQVIERLVRELSKERTVFVVTGDYLQQQMVFGGNVFRKPPRELIDELRGGVESGGGGRGARGGGRNRNDKSQGRPSSKKTSSSKSKGYRLEDMVSGEARSALDKILKRRD